MGPSNLSNHTQNPKSAPKLLGLWGRTVRCAKTWLFSTTGSLVSSED